MNITCPYCGKQQLSSVPICIGTKCNKYWYIKDLNLLYNQKKLYTRLCYNELFNNRVTYKKIKIYHNNIATERENILYNIYKNENWNLELLENKYETYFNELSKFKCIKIPNMLEPLNIIMNTSKNYLSTIYNCKALIGDASAS